MTGSEVKGLTLPTGNTITLIGKPSGCTVTGGEYIEPQPEKGTLNDTCTSTYWLSVDGKTLKLVVDNADDLGNIDSDVLNTIKGAETINISGTLNAADIAKLVSFTDVKDLNLSGVTITENATLTNSSVKTIDLTGATITGVLTLYVGTEGNEVKVVGIEDSSKLAGEWYYVYDGEHFGVGNNSKYLTLSEGKTVKITLATAGDLASLAMKGVDFSDALLVQFITADGVSMNATDFSNMNIFGTSHSVILDFTNAYVTTEARQSANLNNNGVLIGTARAADPQTTYALYKPEARAKINAMLNITEEANGVEGKLELMEIFAEANAAAIDEAKLRGLFNELVQAYPDINDVKIQGAAFHDATSDSWLKNVCNALDEATNVTSFSVYEYTVDASANIALKNPNIKQVDFAYLWDEGNGNTATLDLHDLTALETADVKLANLKKVDLRGIGTLKSVDVTAANSGMELDITGCGTAEPVKIYGGQTFRGTITPDESGKDNTYYTLEDDSEVEQEWQDAVAFGSNGSTYQFGYEKTVVKITIKKAGDLALLTDANQFARARVVSISTASSVSLNADDLKNLVTFGSKGDVNIDFTYAKVADDAWKSAVYPTNPTLIFTPGSARPRTFYKNYMEKYAYEEGTNGSNVRGMANIYDSSNDGVRNTIEVYGIAEQPVSLARRLMRLYPEVTEVVVHGKINEWTEANDQDNVKWLEMLSAQLCGIKEINSLTVFAYNFENSSGIRQSAAIANPNLKYVDFSDAIGGETMDLTGCPNLETAVFMGTDGHDLDIRGLKHLKALNFTNSKGGIKLLFNADEIANVTIYGCKRLANHATVHAVHANPELCLGDLPLPYELDPNTDLDITIDLDLGRNWNKFGRNPRSLRELLKYIRTDLARSGETHINDADPTKRYNYVKIKGALKPKNMGALNMYVSGDSFEEENPISMSEKFNEGDIVCKFLDLSEARPIADELDGDGNEVPISWFRLLRSQDRTIEDGYSEEDSAYGLGVQTAAVDYVILPPGLGKDEINAETFKGFLDLKAAGSASEDGKSLVAYVKTPGTLYFLTAYMDVLNSGGYKTGSVVRTVCDDAHAGYKHWYFVSGPDNLRKLTLSGRINAFDLTASIAVTGEDGHKVTYCLEDGHITTNEIHSVKYSSNAESVAAAEGQYGSKGALAGANIVELDLKDASFMDKGEGDNYINAYPKDFTLSALGCIPAAESNFPKDVDVDRVTVILPKNTIELPQYFVQNNKYIKEIHLPKTLQTIRKYAFFSTNLTKVTCEAENGETVDKSGDGKVAFVLPANLELIETEAFGQLNTVKVTDVYVMARKTPTCEYNAFHAPMYYGWGGFKGNDAHPIKRANYNNNGDLFTILHYPEGLDDVYRMRYTDIDRKYTLQDEDGDTNGEGQLKMWPRLEEFYRSYAQALVGVTWKAWDEGKRGGEGPLGVVESDETNYSEKYETPKESGAWIDGNVYDYKKYIGWHQFVLADNYYFNPEDPNNDDPVRNFERFKKNVWYSVCFPYNLTKSQLLKYFGAIPHDDGTVTVKVGNKTIVSKDPVYPEVRTLVQVLRSKEKGKVTFMFCRDLVEKGEKVEISTDGKTYQYKAASTVDVGDIKNDPIIIEAGKPYILRPCYPDGDGEKDREGFRPVSYASKYNVQVVGPDVPRFDNVSVPYKDHNIHAIDADVEKTAEGYTYVYEGGDPQKPYMYNYVGVYSKLHTVPQYSFFFAVPSTDPFTTYIYREMTPGEDKPENVNSRRPWVQYSAIIGGRASSEFTLGDKENKDVTNFFLEFLCNNDYFGEDESQQAKPYSFNFAFTGDEDAETTAIEDVPTSDKGKNIDSSTIYNLNGIRVSDSVKNLQKGIYIMNGRKFVVK